MNKKNLDHFIQSETNFITDIEQIVDLLYESDQVYLYDTSAISTHELAFKKYNDLLFFAYSDDFPVLVTDTIVNEMRLIEDEDYRYLTYLSKFSKVLFVKEENLVELLKIDYEVSASKSKYLIASERAFSNIQWLREKVIEAKRNFSSAEKLVYDAYSKFFEQNSNKNRGELSLLWVSVMLEHIAPKTKITFVGIDDDLYEFVARCYFSPPKFYPFSNNIFFLSDDKLLQDTYQTTKDQALLLNLMTIYRNANRATRYHMRENGLMNLNRMREKINNDDYFSWVVDNKVEIIY
ncbi:hypothetical protein [Aquibacillus sediminis]|uniref:hypothetical protein n=1 Tax=Aquibacillus sediminis TaxID=2574734 RepID=UPI001107D504|nr:hypothetical protein [Aquibacillus sediminis]